MPYPEHLEQSALPQPGRVVEAVRAILGGNHG